MANIINSSASPELSGNSTPLSSNHNEVRIRVAERKCFSFNVPDSRDKTLIEDMVSSIASNGWNNTHIDTVRQLFQLLQKYDINETIRFLEHIQLYGIMWEIRGDTSKDLVAAKDYYEKSSQEKWLCGTCKLGRCYAEGRGCQKNLVKAEQYLEAVVVDCPEAEQFLDWYGLR